MGNQAYTGSGEVDTFYCDTIMRALLSTGRVPMTGYMLLLT